MRQFATGFCNRAHRLRTGFNSGSGQCSANYCAQICWMRLIFEEKVSGGRWERPELHRLLGQLHKGDVLVVWKLDRLSRSLKDVLTLMEKVQHAAAGFQSLTEAIDTTSPGGRMMMQIVGSFAEF